MSDTAIAALQASSAAFSTASWVIFGSALGFAGVLGFSLRRGRV